MSDWTLIYSTDSGGAPVFGSLSALKVAVLAAADVKVMYSPRSGIWWSRYCASVSTRGSGSSSLVSATYMEAADTKVGATGLEFEIGRAHV